MKFLKILLGIVATLLVVFFIGGLFLPKKFAVERSIVVNVADSVVYNYAADYRNFNQWSPWHEADPNAKYEIAGVQGEPGYTFSWGGKEVGKGKFELVRAEPYKALYQKLFFIEPWESSNDDNMFFERTNEGTKVTWSFSGEHKSTFERWMGLMFNGMVGKDYEKGLGKLKSAVVK